ncbi:hypothetical protein GGI20_003056 [Coemansia sp. BCRC 34301]|nr:hypothetical protein GGI20_003056 [Coemansia sp. BCRC 34301]
MRAFAAQLKAIVPMVKNVYAMYSSIDNTNDVPSELIGRFVRLLYFSPRQFRAVNFNTPKSCKLVPNFTSGITELEIDWDDNYEIKARIAHLNALTLVGLEIRFGHAKDIGTLINSHEDYLVVYPNLSRLQFTATSTLQQTTKSRVNKGVVPFPKLQVLRLNIDYPFADDVLFRGNSQTLEYLKIKPDIETIYMLDRYGIFTIKKYKKLRYIGISEKLVADASKAIVVQFVLKMATHAHNLCITDAAFREEFVLSIVRNKTLDSLQYLDVRSFELSLCETINLLASLPSLKSLVSSSAGLGHQFDDMDFDELGDYMLMAYYPLSKVFNCWTCFTLNPDAAEEEALCAVLLAIACPRLSCAAVRVSRHSMYCKCVRELMSVEPYAGFLELVEPLPFENASAMQRSHEPVW